MNQEQINQPIKKLFYKKWPHSAKAPRGKWFWVIVGIVILLLGGIVVAKHKDSKREQEDNNKFEDVETGGPKYLEFFPVKIDDFVRPAKMYGLWPYGVKGNNSSSHNEGHPGWDFELKKGSKVYAVSDLTVFQIHDGDHATSEVLPKVIEAYANLADGKYHIVYHSVVNIDSKVVEGAKISKGEVLAEVGFPLSDNSAMIHFGVFPPHDSVGACPSPYFSPELQTTIQQTVDLSIDNSTSKPFSSACIGKINKEIYIQNYPDHVQYLGGGEQWE